MSLIIFRMVSTKTEICHAVKLKNSVGHYIEEAKVAGRDGASPLEQFTTNLNARAKMGMIDPLDWS